MCWSSTTSATARSDMARRTTDVTIAAEGRDKGKVFSITEMPAADAEEWGMRIFLSLTRAGIDLPEEVMGGGMAAIAAVLPGIMAGLLLNGVGSLHYEEVRPLLQQMMDCVRIREATAVRALTDDDIEEVGTRLFLRGEVFKLHTGFSESAAKPA